MDAFQDLRPRVAILCGPTASGKTGLAVDLSRRIPLEVVSADSRQVYRGMDIGTAKPTRQERRQVPHHLIDILDPDEVFSAADYCTRAHQAIAGIAGRDRLPLVVGGTGLYIRALTAGLVDVPPADPGLRKRLHDMEQVEGPGTLHRRLARIDPEAARVIHPHNRVRIVRALEVWELTGRPLSAFQAEHRFAEEPYRTLKIGLRLNPETLDTAIAARVDAMLDAGLVSEVASLLEKAGSVRPKALQTIGYRETADFLAGRTSLPELRAAIIVHTRQYAKRQLTWFRKDKSIIWVDPRDESAKILTLFDDIMKS